MFRILPRQCSELLGLLLFPFQVYPVVTFWFYFVLHEIWPHGKAYADQFEPISRYMVLGSVLSFLVLASAIIAQLSAREYRQTLWNCGFAVLDFVVVLICLPNFVRS